MIVVTLFLILASVVNGATEKQDPVVVLWIVCVSPSSQSNGKLITVRSPNMSGEYLLLCWSFTSLSQDFVGSASITVTSYFIVCLLASVFMSGLIELSLSLIIRPFESKSRRVTLYRVWLSDGARLLFSNYSFKICIETMSFYCS